MEMAKPQKVDVRFVCADEDEILPGTVVVRDDAMALEVYSIYGPYSVHGRRRNHWFEGENTAPTRQNDVHAKWADVGGVFVGIWIEDGWEYLFSFRIPLPSPVSRAKRTSSTK
jgi:hypothetical protein